MADAYLNYPVGIGAAGGIDGQPYMLLTSYESKNAIESTGQTDESRGTIMSSIALYIPPNGLRTAFEADWGGLEGGALKATMGSAVSKMNFSAIPRPGGAGGGFDWDAGNISSS